MVSWTTLSSAAAVIMPGPCKDCFDALLFHYSGSQRTIHNSDVACKPVSGGAAPATSSVRSGNFRIPKDPVSGKQRGTCSASGREMSENLNLTGDRLRLLVNEEAEI